MSSTTFHPSCGTVYAANDTTGHCSQCHGTFYGLGAFVRHQFHLGNKVLCSDPATSGNAKWRLDDSNVWHYGTKMTEKQKKEAWG